MVKNRLVCNYVNLEKFTAPPPKKCNVREWLRLMYFGTAQQNSRILILFINLKTGTIIIQWDNGGGGRASREARGKRGKNTGRWENM